MRNVLWIEADPETYSKLLDNLFSYRGSLKSAAENFVVSDKDGKAEFFVTSNNVSSSLMELDKHEAIYPDTKFKKKILVETKKLDSYLKRILAL